MKKVKLGKTVKASPSVTFDSVYELEEMLKASIAYHDKEYEYMEVDGKAHMEAAKVHLRKSAEYSRILNSLEHSFS